LYSKRLNSSDLFFYRLWRRLGSILPPLNCGERLLMKLRHVYLCLCFLGAALPLSQLGPWLVAHGLNLQLLVSELFSTRIGAFFGLDVIVSAMVLFLFIGVEGRRTSTRNLWVPIVATLAVGVSLGFPVFLYMRQLKLEAQSKNP
jgi:hypothetical protein